MMIVLMPDNDLGSLLIRNERLISAPCRFKQAKSSLIHCLFINIGGTASPRRLNPELVRMRRHVPRPRLIRLRVFVLV